MAGFLAALPLVGKLLKGGGLLRSAYGGGMGLVNLGMDVIPLALDIANNDVGLKSFSSFGGTLLGTKFGGRELNKLGESKLQEGTLERAKRYNSLQAKRASEGRPQISKSFAEYDNQGRLKQTAKLQNDPQYSRQGYNMPVGMAADVGLYSLTSGTNQPKNSPEVEPLPKQQEVEVSPVTRYIQMTGGL